MLSLYHRKKIKVMDKFKQTLIEAIEDNKTEMVAPSREYTDMEIVWMRGYNQALQDMLSDFTEDYNKFLEDMIKNSLN
jgi:hypothetical protein